MEGAPIKINDVEKSYISNQQTGAMTSNHVIEYEDLRSAKLANNEEPNHHNRRKFP
jgi:hypothetical protein